MYGSLEAVAERTANVIAADPGVGTSVFFTAWGQILMITMILGVVLPVAVHGLVLSFMGDAVVAEQVRFRALMGLLLPSLMAAIALFEAWQSLGVWMHTRYYTYLIPLAIVVLIEAITGGEQKLWPWAKYAVTGVFFGLATINLITAAAPFASNWIDAPDFYFQITNLALSSFAAVVSIVAALIWPWFRKTALGIALILSVSLSIFSGQSNTDFLKSTFGQEMSYEHIARVLRDFIPQNEVDRTVMYGQYEVLQRTAFSALSGGIEIRSLSEGALEIGGIDQAKAWLLALGDAEVIGFSEPTIVGAGYRMYSLDSSNSLIPRNERVIEFSNACPNIEDSDWACGSMTEVTLQGGFPSNANVDLIIELSPEASEGEIEIVLGGAVASGKFSPGINAINVKFSGTSPVETLLIRAKSSDAIGLGIDSRFVRVLWGLGGR